MFALTVWSSLVPPLPLLALGLLGASLLLFRRAAPDMVDVL